MEENNPIPGLYAELNRFGQNGDYDRALKISNKILSASSADVTAFKCKIVCLIQLSRFDEALTAIHKKSQLASELSFERAYCEYRLNRAPEALKTMRSISEPDLRVKELLAQVLYRVEQYAECLDTYRDLLKHTEDDYEDERVTNMAAALAALQDTQDEPVADLGLRTDTYELCYNHATYLLAQGKVHEALAELDTAEHLCREKFDEDPEAADDMDDELAVIRAQRGYVLQCIGQAREAADIYSGELRRKPTDLALNAVLCNNSITLNKDQNVFDSKKKMKSCLADGLQHKLTSRQRRAVATNRCLLYMFTNQAQECRLLASQLRQKTPSDVTPALIEAALLAREKRYDEAVAVLEAVEHSSLKVRLTLAQLQLSRGHVYAACAALRALGDSSHAPGVVSALVTLYLSEEDRDAAAEVLGGAVAWYRENDPASPHLGHLVRANAQFQLKHGDARMATEMLEEVRRRDPGDLRALAQLIAAYSRYDPARAEQASRSLPATKDVAGDVDVAALESALCSFGPKYVKKPGKAADPGTPGPQSPGPAPVKRRRKRKGKLPKNCEVGSTPDPERWLPRRERSYYKGKRRDKRRAEVSRGPQGAAAPSGDLDMSMKAASASPSASEPASPASAGAPSTAAPGPRQQKPAPNKAKKKKGKGGKW